MTARTQQDRTPTNNTPPANNALLPGQLFVEMGTPLRLWTGVPTSIAPAGNKLILDASQYVTAFNTRVGPVTLTGADITSAGGALLASPVFTGDPQAPTPPAGDADTSVATTAFVAAATATANRNTGRNLIHNPLFNVAQRGAGPFNASGVYLADRWRMISSLDTLTFGINPINDASRAQIADEAARSSLGNSFTGNAGASAFSLLIQNIEDVYRLANKTVTFSFWAQGTAGLKVGVSIDQSFGTGGSPSAAVTGNGQAVTISGTWARYSLTFMLPSVSGKTMGTNGDHFTQLNMWFSGGSTMNPRTGSIGVQSGGVNLWGVQLEIGSVATPLEKPDPRYDIANCQRFYQQFTGRLDAYNVAGGITGWSVALMVVMRALPTAAVNFTGSANNTGSTVSPLTQGSIQIYSTAVVTGNVVTNVFTTLSADL